MSANLVQLLRRMVESDLKSVSGRALIEERYWSLRRQVPIVYLLGLVNLSAMELASTGRLTLGPNLPTFILGCGVVRLAQWFASGRHVDHAMMVRRMKQTVWFAVIVCSAVCARCLQLFQTGDPASHMAVLLFGGLTAIGVAYGLTAVPAAGRVPLVLIIVPLAAAALFSRDPQFAAAAFALAIVAALTMRLLTAHSRHFTDVVKSRSMVVREQQRSEHAHHEAIVAATTDFLTGLPNRRAFVAALEKLSESDEEGSAFAVAILDLNRFKIINDTYGHGAGDALLKEVASRLTNGVCSRGIVARLGGDEYGVLLPAIGGASDAQRLGNAILETVNGPAVLGGWHFVISACCGIALSRTGEHKSPSRVMADADMALYQAKETTGTNLAVFQQEMEAPRLRRTQIEAALLAPDIQRHLHIEFQPIFDLGSGRIMAHEALARWNDPVLGKISPAEFVPVAEQLNLIDDLNTHLMMKAFSHARTWPAAIKLSFNLSAIQLCSAGTAGAVLRALERASLPASRLQVEVTETALLADFDRARSNLAQMKESGATIVLDDFGAGYASIGYLRQLQFDQIKLDGALVTAAQHSADGKRLLRAVVGLCEILGVASIAEHVESEELLQLVSDAGCNGAQGFWLMPPVRQRDLPRSQFRMPRIHARRAA